MSTTDAILVDQSRSGDRQAFAEIVARYQTLICSIAFAATGSLNVSEELAQEAFVSAWKSLHALQDPQKLRPWLCGIVRNLTNSRLRNDRRDLLGNAADIEQSNVADHKDSPVDSTIAREEAELLNRTLEEMPDMYREPLVLFYREHQSVSRVAEQLDLTPSAVKQRLARGREMIRQEVAAVIERGLLQSAPGRAFTIGVLAALPIMSGTAKAATVSVSTAKGVSTMSSAGIAGLTGAILGPIAGILGGWFGYSMSMRAARSDEERAFIRKSTLMIIGLIFIMGLAMAVLIFFGRQWMTEHPTWLAAGIASVVVGYVVALTGTIIWTNRRLAQIRRDTGTVDRDPALVAQAMPRAIRQFQYPRHYESKWRLLGLPLLSVRFSGASSIGRKDIKPAVGWIAISDRLACGPLFACGSFAVGGITFGAVSCGLLSFGGLALGLIALGGAAIGGWCAGGFALGWAGFGGIAVAWKAAIGGVAIAHEYGLGGGVVAPHANDEAAKAFVESSRFFGWSSLLMSPWGWWVVVAIGLVPMWIAARLLPVSECKDANQSE